MNRTHPRYVVMLVLLTATAVLSVMVRYGKAVPLRQSLDQFPLRVGSWYGTDLGRFPEEVMKVLRATDYLNREYTGLDGTRLNFYIGYYEQQRAGESMHSPKNCLPGAGWEVLESKRQTIAIPKAGKSIEVNFYTVQNESSKLLAVYWYDTHGRSFASEYQGKAILVWEAIQTGRTDGALIRIMLPSTRSESRARESAVSFAQEIYPLLKDYLPE